MGTKVNTTAIGNRTAAKGKAELEREGFVVYTAKKGRAKNSAGFWFSYGEDFFGLFDAIAVGDEFDVRFVQFTTRDSTVSGGATASKRDEIAAWAKKLHYHRGALEVTLEVWTWVKRRGWIKEILTTDYSWSQREHFNSKPTVKAAGAAGDKAERRAAPGGNQGQPASPAQSNRLDKQAIQAYAENLMPGASKP